MIETFNIAGYTRISVDDELDRDNVSIENQKAIIEDFVKTQFPGSSLTFFEDRDRSGYTFEQREGYQKMREGLMSHKYDILIIKDFSRFSRRNSRGLVELEDLRDAGVRIISIGDGIDFPNDDDWLKSSFSSSSMKCRSRIPRARCETSSNGGRRTANGCAPHRTATSSTISSSLRSYRPRRTLCAGFTITTTMMAGATRRLLTT